MKTRQELLAFARAKGYKGKPELADIKAFFRDELGYDPETIKVAGKAVKFDDIWAKAAELESDPEPDPVSNPEPEPEPEPETKTRVKQTGGGWNRGPGKVDAKTVIHTPETFRIRAEKAAYKRRIVSGKAAFDDPDIAERAGAFFRLCMCKGLEGKDNYSQKQADLDILAIRGKDMSEGINTAGGAMVPSEFDPTLIWLTEKYGAARKLARIQRMSRDHMPIPVRTGRISMTASPEAGSMTATNNTYGNIELTAKKWYALIKSSSELIEDSAINIADEITQSVAEAQANSEDSAYQVGDGSVTYNGITGLVGALPSGAYIAQASSNTWLTQVEADILGIVGAVENVDIKRCAFTCSRQYFYTVIMRLAQAKGGNNAMSTFIYGGEGGDSGEDAMLYGFPVYFNQTAPIVTATTARSLYFGDFKGASVIGDRRDLRIDFSEQRYFDSDQVCWRATSRFTIDIHGDQRATASTVGPIACLKNS